MKSLDIREMHKNQQLPCLTDRGNIRKLWHLKVGVGGGPVSKSLTRGTDATSGKIGSELNQIFILDLLVGVGLSHHHIGIASRTLLKIHEKN